MRFVNKVKLLRRFKVTLSAILDGSFPFELLREALLRAIHDIDAAFSKVSFIYVTEDLIYYLVFAYVAI